MRFSILMVMALGCGEGAETMCFEAGETCKFNIECCDGTCNTGGVCSGAAACFPVGVPCGVSAECCEGLECNPMVALCRPIPGDANTMSFFVTSVGNPKQGGNLGGLEAADLKCQTLINAAPVPDEVKARTWRAYLSVTSTFVEGTPDGTAVNARDRIGFGPWFNIDGIQIAPNLATLHASGIPAALILDEQGFLVPEAERIILTGSNADGTAESSLQNDFMQFGFANASCGNWTSNNSFRNTLGNNAFQGSFSAPDRVFCDLGPTSNSTGRTYCFAAD